MKKIIKVLLQVVLHSPLLRYLVYFSSARSLTAKYYPGWHLGTGQLGSAPILQFRRYIWQNLKKPVVIPWLKSTKVMAYPNEEISRSIYLTGLYEPNQFAYLNKVLKQDMTFIDIGANSGLYSLFAAKKIGKNGVILAIEPSRREFEKLGVNKKNNSLTNLRLLNMAVSNFSGNADLLVASHEFPGHNTFGKFGYECVRPIRTESVRVEKLDNIIPQQKLQTVDFIKIDIEGSEYHALLGALEVLREHHPTVLLELSDRTLNNQNSTSKQVWDLLMENGYKVYRFDDNTGEPVPAKRLDYFDAENIVAVYKG